MKYLLAAMAHLLLASGASAHFAFILPADDGRCVDVVFSEQLEPDMKVSIDKIAATTLFEVDAAGRVAPLEWAKHEHSLTSGTLGRKTLAVGGLADYGFAQSKHTGNKPVDVRYYPKAILGDPAAATAPLFGSQVPLEIVPVVIEGRLAFRALLKGLPLADADCAVLVAGEGKPARAKTNAEGLLPVAIEKPGLVGARVKFVEIKGGEANGKKYDEIHHFATLTVTAGGKK
ncbi:MAG TPA: hypothetical protein VHV55_18800 [Pirellulales bacterium]|jgi:hypothetical protein|nr:hypothetical protein [Pirellulales bacterium]